LRGDQTPGLVQYRQFELRRGLADQRRRQRLAVLVAAQHHAREQQGRQGGERRKRQPADGRAAGGSGRRAHGVLSVTSGPDASGRELRRRDTRKRRSAAVTKPPSIISSAPAQIQRTKGLICIRKAHASSPRGSPRATNRSRVTPLSIAASVMTWPPLA